MATTFEPRCSLVGIYSRHNTAPASATMQRATPPPARKRGRCDADAAAAGCPAADGPSAADPEQQREVKRRVAVDMHNLSWGPSAACPAAPSGAFSASPPSIPHHQLHPQAYAPPLPPAFGTSTCHDTTATAAIPNPNDNDSDDVIELDVTPSQQPPTADVTAASDALTHPQVAPAAGSSDALARRGSLSRWVFHAGPFDPLGSADASDSGTGADAAARHEWRARALLAALRRAGLLPPHHESALRALVKQSGGDDAAAVAAALKAPGAESQLRRLTAALNPQQQAALLAAWREVAATAAGAPLLSPSPLQQQLQVYRGPIHNISVPWHLYDPPNHPHHPHPHPHQQKAAGSCAITELSSSSTSSSEGEGLIADAVDGGNTGGGAMAVEPAAAAAQVAVSAFPQPNQQQQQQQQQQWGGGGGGAVEEMAVDDGGSASQLAVAAAAGGGGGGVEGAGWGEEEAAPQSGGDEMMID